MWGRTLIALIPAYEPVDTLPGLISRLRESGLEAVVVDDGSGPDYDAVFKKAAQYAAVLTHDKNMGKGRALKTGLTYIQDAFPKNCVVVTLDADGQHRVDDAIRVLHLAAAQPGALALGCRHFGKGVPLRSRFGNLTTRLVYRLSTGAAVSDTQTGLRAFDGSLLPFMLGISGERYEYEMNMLLECAAKGVRIVETEIETVYFDNNAGSHFNTLKDSFRVYKEIVKFAFSSFLGFVTDYLAYGLLIGLTGGLSPALAVPICNVAARVVSASVNYTVNKKLVFKSSDSALKTGSQYFLLAAVILCLNTALLTFMTGAMGVGAYPAKLITELTFFIMSFLAQRFIIFKKRSAPAVAGGGNKVIE